MPRRRKNKSVGAKVGKWGSHWFLANVRRQRRRNEMALQSRRINRRRAKGK